VAAGCPREDLRPLAHDPLTGKTDVVAKPRPHRPTPPSAHSRRAVLAQSLLDGVVNPVEQLGGVDVEPLFAALLLGALDEHREELATYVNNRIAALNAVAELVAASRLHVGDHVRLGHKLKPLYLHGKSATIIAKHEDKWIVRLDEPIGRFTNADLRLQATQVEPV
jgi:hypothetical protein